MKVSRRSDNLPAPSRHKLRRPDLLLASVGFIVLALIPDVTLAICDDLRRGPKESLPGTLPFSGADLNYEFAVLDTSNPDVLSFRYCIQNTHSHTMVYVRWGPEGDWHFDNSVAPKDAKPNQYDSLRKSTNTEDDLRYGEQKDQWQATPRRDTLIKVAVRQIHPII